MLMTTADALDNVSGQFDEAAAGLRTAFGLAGMLDSYAFNQEFALDFALDWNASDDLLNGINTSGATATVIATAAAAAVAEASEHYMADEHRVSPGFAGGEYNPYNVANLSPEDHQRYHRVLEENFRRQKLNPPNARDDDNWRHRFRDGDVDTAEKNRIRRALADSARDFDALTQNKYKLREKTRTVLSHPSVSGKSLSVGSGLRRRRR